MWKHGCKLLKQGFSQPERGKNGKEAAGSGISELLP